MSHGKKVCKILKEIRQQIAEKNDIALVTSECHFQGECKGTCPKCEAEVKFLENELNRRRQLGKAVAIAGISLGVAGTFAGCGTPKQEKLKISEEKTVDVNIDFDIMDSLVPPPPILWMGFIVPELVSLDGEISTIDTVTLIKEGEILEFPLDTLEIIENPVKKTDTIN